MRRPSSRLLEAWGRFLESIFMRRWRVPVWHPSPPRTPAKYRKSVQQSLGYHDLGRINLEKGVKGAPLRIFLGLEILQFGGRCGRGGLLFDRHDFSFVGERLCSGLPNRNPSASPLQNEFRFGRLQPRSRVREMACHSFSPPRNSRRSSPFGKIAQLVEQRTENPRVLGSIPSLATTL